MSDFIDLQSKSLPEEVLDPWRQLVRVGLAGPADARIYTPDELAFNGKTLATSNIQGEWVDVFGYRFLTAYIKVTGVVSPNWQGFLSGSSLSYGQNYFSATIGQGPALSDAIPVAITNQPATLGSYGGAGALAVSAMVSITGGGSGAVGEAMLLCVP